MSITLEELLAKAPTKFKKLKPDELAKLNKGKEGILISTMEMGVTNANSAYPLLGIVGAEPCTGVIAYNAATKTAGVWHMPPMDPGIQKIEQLVASIRTDKAGLIHEDQKVDIRLIGGGQFGDDENDRKENFLRLLKVMNNIANIDVISADILDKAHPDSFAIDARNGEMIRGSVDITKDNMWDDPPSAKACRAASIVGVARWGMAAETLKSKGNFHDATTPEHLASRRVN